MSPIHDPYVGYRSFYGYTPPRWTALLVLVVTLAIGAGACSSADTPTASPTTSSPPTTAPAPPTSEPPADAPTVEGIEATIAGLVPPGSPGVIVRFDIGTNTAVETAAGQVALGSGLPLTPQHPFRLGETTVPITAATVLRLHEQGQLSIDDPIAGYLPEDLVARLHVVDGVSGGEDITIRHLLGHTSGLADRGADTPFVEEVFQEPGRVWDPTELVDYGITHADPWFAPGADFSYSDDGYVLLGMIIEAATGEPLHAVYRREVLDRLGMNDTYLEGHEDARGSELSHPYLGEVDALTVHPSVDWGAGGLVSTVADLARFGAAINDGTLFDDAKTLDAMLHDPGTGYGLGIQIRTEAGLAIYSHGGSWGSSLELVPELELVMAGTINQVADDQVREEFFSSVATVVLSAEGTALLHRPEGVETVEVYGRTGAYISEGSGRPTIVFEAGLGNGLEAWDPIIGAAAQLGTVFAYDRAGYGQSDPAPGPRDGLSVVDDLRALLNASGHQPPYVLVGHSLGGTYAQLFARAYPDEVAGLVLVDGTPPIFSMPCPVDDADACAMAESQLDLAPEPMRSEEIGQSATAEQVLAAAPLGPIPAVVLAAGLDQGFPENQAMWIEAQRDQASELGATFVLAEESGHFVQFDQPELVLQAIESVVEQLRGS